MASSLVRYSDESDDDSNLSSTSTLSTASSRRTSQRSKTSKRRPVVVVHFQQDDTLSRIHDAVDLKKYLPNECDQKVGHKISIKFPGCDVASQGVVVLVTCKYRIINSYYSTH